MALLNSCETCYQAELPACPDTIFLYTDSLGIDEDYFLEITDKFGNRYFGNPTNAAYGGVIALSMADLPHGLLTEFSGPFVFRFYTDDECNELKELVFCGEVYECIVVTFYKLASGEREAVICCEPPIPYP